MNEKVAELSIDDLKTIISDCVKESVEDAIEDIIALNSQSYVDSVEEARMDIREGRVKPLEDLIVD